MICRTLYAARHLSIATVLGVLLATALDANGQTRRRQAAEEPENITLPTKDGVEINATYYPSTRGKQATTVICLADWKDSRSVYAQLARRMHNPGQDDEHESFAVVTVDLRGHGDSTRQQFPGGREREIDAARIDRNSMRAMVQQDMEAVRRFLVDKNDAGELNLNRLAIVGAGLGASVAVNWTAVDWSAPPLAIGKQGQDVKVLVLISPEWSYKGLQLTQALRHPGVREEVAFFIMYGGRDRSHAADVNRIEKQLERYHPRPDSLPEGEPHSLTVLAPDTSLQGTKFLTEAGPAAEASIIKFLTVHVSEKDFEWTERPPR